MDDTNKKDFAVLWVAAAESYGKEMTKAQMAFDFNVLKPYPFEIISLAMMKHAEISQWMPKPSDLIAHINPARTGIEAWQEVVGKINTPDGRGGYYNHDNPPKFDPVTQKALSNIGGFAVVCHWPDKRQEYLQDRFVEHYGTASTVATALIGRNEATALLASFEKKRIQ